MSCDTGEGHNSAARALVGAFNRRNIDCTLIDPLIFRGRKASEIVSASYTAMLRKAPALFGIIYKAGDIYSSTRIVSPVYYANSKYAPGLREYIEDKGFDAVVSTHLFPMEALTAIRKKGGFNIPCYGVLTDYTCIPFFGETKLDGYFIPHEELRDEIAKCGIPKEKLFAIGIPVSKKFAVHESKAAAREALGLPADKPVMLIMSGGVGCGNILELCDTLERCSSGDYLACVLTGHNASLKQSIDERFASAGRIKTVSFTKQVNLYMNAADVMLSKPGGLTSTEAAVANVPLVQMLTYAACEAKNIAFFTSHGLSIRAANEREAVSAMWSLTDDKQKAEKMRAMQRACINPNAADDIAAKVAEGWI